MINMKENRIYFKYFLMTVLKRAFSMFDSSKQGKIEKEKVRTILNTMVYSYDDKELETLLDGEDNEGESFE